MHTPLDAMILN